MSQVGSLSATQGVVGCKLLLPGTDTLVANAASVVPGIADPSFYVITFTPDVAVGSYRMILLEASGFVVTIVDVVVAASTWSEVQDTSVVTDQDMRQLRYVLGIDGVNVAPVALGHFNLASFYINTVPSGVDPIVPGGASIVASDLYAVFGEANVTSWSDLDNDNNTSKISARQSWAITLATSDLQSQLESSNYTWSEIRTHAVIKHLVALKAGLLLYGPRGISDEEGKENPMRGHQKMFDNIIKKIHGGLYKLVNATVVDSGVPFSVDPFKTE